MSNIERGRQGNKKRVYKKSTHESALSDYSGYSRRESRIAARLENKETEEKARLDAKYNAAVARQQKEMEARQNKYDEKLRKARERQIEASARRGDAASDKAALTARGGKSQKQPDYNDHEYMKKQYKKQRRKGKRRFLKNFILTVILLSIISGGAAAVYVTKVVSEAPVIHPEKIYEAVDIGTRIYDDNGKMIESIYYSENRRLVKYENLPDNLKNAFIAVEDKTFWKHHGFNIKRIFGAVIDSIGGGGISGTSTITQQLARNVFLADIKSDRTIKRKIIEMYYARQIEEVLTKEEILEAYLNTIYLGYGNYGVSSAARSYFGCNVKKLNLEQCAALAALPQAPDTYALLKNEKGEATTRIRKGLYANDISRERRELILDLMVEQGYISQKEADKAKKPIKDVLKPGRSAGSTSRTYFKDYVIDTVVADLMKTYGKTEQEATNMVYTRGLRIYSTLDTQAQGIITQEFKNDYNFPVTVKGEQPEAAMVIVEVGTGKIKAMAGGRKPKGDMLFNRAISPRQPGSSIKPLAVYGAALQKSYDLYKQKQYYTYNDQVSKYKMGRYITTSSVITDAPMYVNGQNWPRNAGGGYMGDVTFRKAIQQSINTCAVKILMQVGIEYSSQQVEQFGISTLRTDTSQPVNDMNYASLALGGMSDGVTPLDMALAYAVFPNGGTRNSGICYTKVTDRNGKVLLKGKSTETEVLNSGVAWIMTDVLQSVITNGIAGAARVDGVKAGGKTGTTNDQYDIWFDGFTANYAASLWIGTDDNVELTSMSGPAAALWGKIMNQVTNAKKGEYKSMPSNVVKVGSEYYTRGTVPKNEENVLPKSSTRTSTMDDDTSTAASASAARKKSKKSKKNQ